MYAFIKGYVDGFEDGKLIIDCNGVGYDINVSTNTVMKLQGVKDIVKIYTHLNVREDEMSLYGFINKEEKELFELLITVSGIGCKASISILSGMSIEKLRIAIMSGDLKMLSTIKGVGKKTAERIVVELKDKIGSFKSNDIEIPLNNSGNGTDYNDAVEILVGLGFSKSEATVAVTKASTVTDNVDKIVELALKNINK
jgi:Holliday junction DNA helicase RuvA